MTVVGRRDWNRGCLVVCTSLALACSGEEGAGSDADGEGSFDMGPTADRGQDPEDAPADAEADAPADTDAASDEPDGDAGRDPTADPVTDAADDAAVPDLPTGDSTEDVPADDTQEDSFFEVCSVAVGNLLDSPHPARSDTWRVPGDISLVSNFSVLPGSPGVPGGCFEPPFTCGQGGGIDGEEALFTFVAPAAATYYFTTDLSYTDDVSGVDGAELVSNPVLYVLDAPEPTAGVLGCSDDVLPGSPHPVLRLTLEASQEVFVVVDAWSAGDNGLRFGVEVGTSQPSATLGDACEHPPVTTSCSAGARLFCVPGLDGTECADVSGLPRVPSLSVEATGFDFEAGSSDPPVCRGVARDEEGNLVPMVALYFRLTGTCLLNLDHWSIAHDSFGEDPLHLGFPDGTLYSGGGYSVEVKLCLPEISIPFAPADGSDPVTFRVYDDLGARTDPPNAELNRGSLAYSISLYDPR